MSDSELLLALACVFVAGFAFGSGGSISRYQKLLVSLSNMETPERINGKFYYIVHEEEVKE